MQTAYLRKGKAITYYSALVEGQGFDGDMIFLKGENEV
jgi:hypothetical protein